MGTEVDQVWAAIKSHAQSLAESGKTISFRDARRFVTRLWDEECLEAPRREALDYFASELVDHVTEEYRQKATADCSP